MNFKFEKTNDVTAELTVIIEKADYQEKVEKALKNVRQKANMPGFRPGQVPMSLVRRRFGMEVTAEEVQKLLSEKLYGYIREQKIDMLGEPMASKKQVPVDFEEDELTFIFDIALAPQFDAKLSNKDSIPYYTIDITDEMVDRQVKAYAQRGGHYDTVQKWQEGDMVKGHLAELDESGSVKEGGLQKEDAVVLPGYFKNDEQKAKFNDVEVNTVITFNPAEAYNNSAIEISSLLGITKEDAENVRGNFSYQITEITRYVPSELNQQLFDNVFGEGNVNSEDEFRAAIRKQIADQFALDSQFRFMLDVRKYLENRIGELTWPEELLKRIMRVNNQDKDEKYVEDNYGQSVKELEWHLIKEQLSDQTGIKVEQDDVLATAKRQAKMQFAQYGMANVPDEVLTNYANEQLKKKENIDGLVARCVEEKLSVALQDVVKLDHKTISSEDFNKLFEA
ncbi:MAG: trigger factor [Bacteroidaceae bacterium]|nr:trigger factor [Bacteroidaceae bacterium]